MKLQLLYKEQRTVIVITDENETRINLSYSDFQNLIKGEEVVISNLKSFKYELSLHQFTRPKHESESLALEHVSGEYKLHSSNLIAEEGRWFIELFLQEKSFY